MLNNLMRYERIISQNPEVCDPAISVLEVGSGDKGLTAFIDRKIVGVDTYFNTEKLRQNLNPVVASAVSLPFSDDSFDIVVCIDALEHLHVDDRQNAVLEMLRVANKKLIITCPCDLPAHVCENQLYELFKNSGIESQWLVEHLQNGLPNVEDLLNYGRSTEYLFKLQGNEGIVQHFAGVLLDHFFPITQHFNNSHLFKTGFQSPIKYSGWDIFYSYILTIDKTRKKNLSKSCQEYKNDTSPDQEDSRIYYVYHKPMFTQHLDQLRDQVKPIFCGDYLDNSWLDKNVLTDKLNFSDSLENESWSELSAIYKIWKEGPKSEIVGFGHYRRLFCFDSDMQFFDIRQIDITLKDLRNDEICLYDQSIVDLCDSETIILPPPIQLESTVWEQYCNVHCPSHYLNMINEIIDSHPFLISHLGYHFVSREFYANNLFIMNWKNFHELCLIWFSILPRVYELCKEDVTTPYQKRHVAFLSERLFDLWIQYKVSKGIKIKNLPFYYVDFEQE